jgi:3'(2'), 5'-bisphosphate nucleotidase
MTEQMSIGSVLADIVEAASGEILPLWRGAFTTTRKHDDSPVTEADHRAEAVILARLAEAFPDIPVISEEDATAYGTPSAIGPRFFLVDPLDGTKAFVRGDPHFTVNIGLIENRAPVAGAVAAPASGEIWHTIAGGALKRHGAGPATPIRPRPWPEGEALALISHTMKEGGLERLAAAYKFHRSEPMDSSIKFCRLAEGVADIYPRHGPTMEWDTAAGHAVLVAAGGHVATPEGAPFLYGKADQGFRNGHFIAWGQRPV